MFLRRFEVVLFLQKSGQVRKVDNMMSLYFDWWNDGPPIYGQTLKKESNFGGLSHTFNRRSLKIFHRRIADSARRFAESARRIAESAPENKVQTL
jgi:hypothetical protein